MLKLNNLLGFITVGESAKAVIGGVFSEKSVLRKFQFGRSQLYQKWTPHTYDFFEENSGGRK